MLTNQPTLARLALLVALAILISSLARLDTDRGTVSTGELSDTPTPQPAIHTGFSRRHLATAIPRATYSVEVNAGQADSRVRFLARWGGVRLFFTPQEAMITLPTADRASAKRLRLALVGANPDPIVRGEAPLPGKVNYLRGSDPKVWRVGLPTYARVRYSDVYPGIDLVYYGAQDGLEYDLELAPGADLGSSIY